MSEFQSNSTLLTLWILESLHEEDYGESNRLIFTGFTFGTPGCRRQTIDAHIGAVPAYLPAKNLQMIDVAS
jgi:hypothetical protein